MTAKQGSQNDVWLTCCALHNKLLDVEVLNKAWKNGVHSHWWGRTEHGKFCDEEIPFAIRRLIDPNSTDFFRLCHYGVSQCGYECLPVEVSDDKEDEN